MTWISSPPWPLPSSLFHCFLDGWASCSFVLFHRYPLPWWVCSSLTLIPFYFCSLFPLPVWMSVLPPPSSALTCPWLVVALLLLLLSCLLVCWCLLSAAGHVPTRLPRWLFLLRVLFRCLSLLRQGILLRVILNPWTLELHAPTSPICAAFSFLVPFCPPGLLLSPSAAS